MRFVLYVEVMLSAFDVYMCVVKSDVWRFTCDTIWSNSIEAGLQITFNCVASLIVFRFQRSHNNRRNHWEGNNGKAQLTIGWRRGIRYICLAIEYADRLWCEHQQRAANHYVVIELCRQIIYQTPCAQNNQTSATAFIRVHIVYEWYVYVHVLVRRSNKYNYPRASERSRRHIVEAGTTTCLSIIPLWMSHAWMSHGATIMCYCEATWESEGSAAFHCEWEINYSNCLVDGRWVCTCGLACVTCVICML